MSFPALDPNPVERREISTTNLEIDPDPRKLRQSIAQIDGILATLERGTARKVRLLVAEIVARSTDTRRRPGGLIRLDAHVGHDAIRLEVTGGALLTPRDVGEPERKLGELLPYWVLNDLADRWGLDRRSSDPTMWFVVNRRQAGAGRFA